MFLDILAAFWDNYQRFAFAIDLISSKGNIFYRTFNSAIKYQGMTEGTKNEVGPVPVLAVNELSHFIKKLNIIHRYSEIYCAAIAKEREGKTVQSEKIRDTAHFF